MDFKGGVTCWYCFRRGSGVGVDDVLSLFFGRFSLIVGELGFFGTSLFVGWAVV